MHKAKTAIILGATGLTGNMLLHKLLVDKRYDKIKIFTRRPLRLENPKVTEILCDLLDIDSYKDIFFGDEVFCCIGTTTKKTPDKEIYKNIDYGIPVEAAKLCKTNGIKTFLVISSIGANANSSNFYLRTKGEMEREVLERGIENTFLLRPSMIGGKRIERRFIESLFNILMKGINFILFGALRKYRLIDADIIANAMLVLAKQGFHDTIIESDQIYKIGNI